MEHAKKMALVPQNILQTMFNPPQSYLSELDEMMEQILKDKTLPADVKAKRYNHILKQYTAFRENDEREPIKVAVTEEQNNDPLEGVLDNISPRVQSKARVLLNYIRKSPFISWTSNRELIYQGRTIPKSNAIDLISRFVNIGNQVQRFPIGWEEFGKALLSQNIPRTAIGNKVLWDRIEPSEEFDEVFTEASVNTPSPIKPSSSKRRKRTVQPIERFQAGKGLWKKWK